MKKVVNKICVCEGGCCVASDTAGGESSVRCRGGGKRGGHCGLAGCLLCSFSLT